MSYLIFAHYNLSLQYGLDQSLAFGLIIAQSIGEAKVLKMDWKYGRKTIKYGKVWKNFLIIGNFLETAHGLKFELIFNIYNVDYN